MADQGYPGRNASSQNNDSVFSWSDEFEAHNKRTTNDHSRKQSHYKPESSIFSEQSGQSSGMWSDPQSQQGYRYEYPGEDYKYTPKADYGKFDDQKSYFDSIYSDVSSYSPQSRTSGQMQRPVQRQSSGGKTAQRPPQSKNAKKKPYQSSQTGAAALQKPKKKKAPAQAPRSATPLGKEEKKRNAEAAKKSAKKNPGKSGKKVEPTKKKKASKARQSQRKDLKEQSRLAKRNKRIEKLKASGVSTDEIRSVLQREAIRRKRLHNLFVSLCVIACVAAVIAAAGIIYGLPIEKINVEGSKVYKKDEIIAAAELSVGDNMLLVSQKRLNEKLTTNLPYIGKVEVVKNLPDTITLKVTDTADRLLFVTSKGYICTDKNGKVTSEKKQAAKNGKIKIEGLSDQEYEIGKKFVPDEENGNRRKYDLALKVISALEKSEIKNCTAIKVENEDRIELSCTKKIKIYLDSQTDFEEKLTMLSQKMKEMDLDPSKVHSFDLRYKGQIVYKNGIIS